MNSRAFKATCLALLLVVSLSMVSRAATATTESDAPLPSPNVDLQPGEIVQIVIDALFLWQAFRESRQDARSQRNIALFNLDIGRSGEGSDDRQQRAGSKQWRFVGQRVKYF